MLKLNIIIVGAGISGLSTAIALQRKGHTVTVLERHPACQALGGPVVIAANGSRVLIDYGMEETMKKINLRQTKARTYTRRYDNGKILGSRETDQSLKDYGFPTWSMARYRLQEVLYEVAVEKGVEVLFDKTAVSVDMEKPSITLENSEVLTADLIIGSDGIRSVVRDAIAGTAVKSISPFTAYNIDIPRSLLKDDPSLSQMLVESNFWFGPQQIVVAINMPDMGDSFNVCLISEEQEGTAGAGEWYELGDLSKVKAKFAGFEPTVKKLLELAEPENCYIWRLSEIPPLEKWVSDSGRAVITGDAAHAMLPYAGNGANSCIEDSASLAICLEKVESVSDLPKVLKAFEAIRKPRTEWFVKKGRENAREWHLPDGPQQEQRDQFLGRGPMLSATKSEWDGKHIDDPPEGQFNPLVFPYSSGFDAIDYTNRKLKDILG